MLQWCGLKRNSDSEGRMQRRLPWGSPSVRADRSMHSSVLANWSFQQKAGPIMATPSPHSTHRWSNKTCPTLLHFSSTLVLESWVIKYFTAGQTSSLFNGSKMRYILTILKRGSSSLLVLCVIRTSCTKDTILYIIIINIWNYFIMFLQPALLCYGVVKQLCKAWDVIVVWLWAFPGQFWYLVGSTDLRPSINKFIVEE